MLISKQVKLFIVMAAVATISMNHALADTSKKTKQTAYTEDQFLNSFSGKSRKVVLERLGNPDRKEQSVKPTGADTVLAGKGKEEATKPVNVEMWYYNGVVNYAPKKAYKFTELTFVNDRCMNIAF